MLWKYLPVFTVLPSTCPFHLLWAPSQGGALARAQVMAKQKDPKGQEEGSTVQPSRYIWNRFDPDKILPTVWRDIRSLTDWIYWNNINSPERSLSFGKLLYIFLFSCYDGIELVLLILAPSLRKCCSWPQALPLLHGSINVPGSLIA